MANYNGNRLRKDSLLIKGTIAGERKFNESLYEKLRDLDFAIKEKNYLFNRRKKKSVTKNVKNLKSGINNITADDLTNKDNLVYLDNHPYNVLLDTGSEENYISYPLVELFKLKYYKHEKPKVRYLFE